MSKQVKMPDGIPRWPVEKLIPYARNPRTHSRRSGRADPGEHPGVRVHKPDPGGLADNKLALNAGWDEELLRLELAELKD